MASDKKILFGIIIIGLLIIAIGAGAIFYWQKTHIALDISPKAVKAKCLSDIDQISNQELVEKVKNLPFLSEEELKNVSNKAIKYLVCKVDQENREFDEVIKVDLYNRTINLIQQLKIPEEKINLAIDLETLSKLIETHNKSGETVLKTRDNTRAIELALNPIEALCPNGEEERGFLEICLRTGPLSPEQINKFSSEEVEELKDKNCYNLCETLSRYTENISYFEEDMNNQEWHSDLNLLDLQFHRWAAVAYRFGGRELSFKLCDSISGSTEIKEDCKHYAESLEYIDCKEFGYSTKECQLKNYQECEGIYNETKDLICESDIRKYSR